MFTGTTAPEALQVGQYMQQLYDIASTGGADVAAATDNLQSLDRDIPLQNEVRNKINTDIAEITKAGDWETRVPQVRALGRYYASRAMELAAPLKQFQEYQTSLDNKELNLTPEQKAVLVARSKAGYQGLQKDPLGRFVGKFAGVGAAENIDMTKWADSVMSGMKEFKDASKIEYSDGKGYLVTNGSSKEWVSEQRVQEALNNALRMDTKVQSFLGMEGDNAAFNASRIPISMVPDKTASGQPNMLKQQALQLAVQQGIAPEQAYAALTRSNRINDLAGSTSRYLRSKYAYTKREGEQGLQSDATWIHNQKEASDLGMFGDAVTDMGIDLTQRFGSTGDIEAAITTTGDTLDQATTAVAAQKQVIARALGTTADQLTDGQISGYFTRTDPTGLGKYRANVQAVEAARQSQEELTQLRREAMNLAVKRKYPGSNFEDLQAAATKQFSDAIGKGVSVTGFDPNNQKVKISSSNVKDFEVIDGDKGTGSANYIQVRDKTNGKVFTIYPDRSDMGGHSSLKSIGEKFDNIDWKREWKEAAANIRSNSMWMPLNNKTTPDGETTKSGAYASRVNGILRAGSGGLNIKDANLVNLDSDDTKDVRGRISAGKFDVLGVGKVGSDGKLYVKLSVLKDAEADDPAEKYQTVVVGVDSNMANKLSNYAVEAGQRDQDQRAVQFGLAMRPGSGYEQVLNMGTTGRLLITEQGRLSVPGMPPKSGGYKTPLYEIVPNITGQASDAITYEVYKLNDKGERVASEATFGDAFDLGAFLDANRAGGRVVEKKTK